METNTAFTENSNSTNSNDHSINNTNNSSASKERWNCSLMNEFDYLVFCASLIGQATNYYRYGEKKNCSNHFRNVKWCLKMKSKNLEERKKMVLEREAEKEAQYIKKKSSLDVWEMRDTPLTEIFPLNDNLYHNEQQDNYKNNNNDDINKDNNNDNNK
ncbi:hypothetical protein Glove_158g106 [Diversispora epigaea]|uniref:Uncharacterized protein n=1 Tax=Diversispora epigaea TaxID=1348612 RepID=A0A397IRR2_9GLOM|nr:hypothetical protein Glove_158g106 [Diversispora epigaea]